MRDATAASEQGAESPVRAVLSGVFGSYRSDAALAPTAEKSPTCKLVLPAARARSKIFVASAPFMALRGRRKTSH